MNNFEMNKRDRFPRRDQRGHGPHGFGPHGFGPEWADRLRERMEEGGAPGPHGMDRPFGPGFGRGFGPSFVDSGRKAPRGSIWLALLDMLLDGPKNGAALIQEFKTRTDGKWAPVSGTVYPALGKLISQQLIEVTDDNVYSLTPTGRQTAEKSHDAVTAIFEHMAREESEPGLFGASRKLFGALFTLLNSGTAEQQTVIKAKIDELTKEVYRTLGE